MTGPAPATVDRAFLRLEEGLVHYRHAGGAGPGAAAVPLYMAHAGPGSSRGLEPLLAQLASGRRVIAPDMLGNGDSAPPAAGDVDIAYHADCAVRILDALGLQQVDFYGTHTGATIGLALATRHPSRVRNFVLDGVLVIADAAERAEMLAHYAPPMTPDDHGGYLAWAYQFARDMSLFYPHYLRDTGHCLDSGAQSPAQLHLFVTDILKALTTYHIAYHAVFRFDAVAALRALRHRALLTCQTGDPLAGHLPHAAALAPMAGQYLHPADATPAQVAAVVAAFLDAGESPITSR